MLCGSWIPTNIAPNFCTTSIAKRLPTKTCECRPSRALLLYSIVRMCFAWATLVRRWEVAAGRTESVGKRELNMRFFFFAESVKYRSLWTSSRSSSVPPAPDHAPRVCRPYCLGRFNPAIYPVSAEGETVSDTAVCSRGRISGSPLGRGSGVVAWGPGFDFYLT